MNDVRINSSNSQITLAPEERNRSLDTAFFHSVEHSVKGIQPGLRIVVLILTSKEHLDLYEMVPYKLN